MPEQVHKYEIDIFWSDEDGCFIACVPDLENCAAWGDTHEETLARAHVAIRADLASREKFGERAPEPTPRLLVSERPVGQSAPPPRGRQSKTWASRREESPIYGMRSSLPGAWAT